MRRLVLAAIGAAVLLGSTPALAQSPALTVAQIPCERIVGEVGTAVLACVDEPDGVTLRLHELSDSTWLEVLP